MTTFCIDFYESYLSTVTTKMFVSYLFPGLRRSRPVGRQLSKGFTPAKPAIGVGTANLVQIARVKEIA
jgi:hypothetical protein